MKRVLITGGSRGIGRACVEYFTNAGNKVAFVYLKDDESAKLCADNYGAYAIKADISKPEEAARAVKEALDLLGGIDILVNNAGVAQIKLFTDLTDADLEKMLSTNLLSALCVAREAVKPMISQKWGRIINIGSMWGKCGASCEVHYSASKAGVRGMTMALAKELGPSGITVNCVEPGVIDTDMNSELDKETLAQLCDETPMCRVGKTQDVSALVGFLASEEASFITGQIIGVDGGFAI